MKRSHGIKLLLLLVVVLAGGWMVRETDFDEVGRALALIGPKFALTLAISGAAYLLGTLGWKYCLPRQGQTITWHQLFIVRHIGETGALLNPTGALGGDLLKSVLLRDSGLLPNTVLSSLISSRVLMVLTQLMLSLLVGTYLGLSGEYHLPTIRIPAAPGWRIFFAGLLIGTALCYLVARLVRSHPPAYRFYRRCRLQIGRALGQVRHQMQHDPGRLLVAFAFFLLHWIVGALEFYVILRALHADVTPLQAIFVDLGVVFFKAAGTFIPGQAGIEELGNKMMLAIIGVPGTTIWITASVIRRLRQFFWIGVGVVLYLGCRPKPLTAPAHGSPVR